MSLKKFLYKYRKRILSSECDENMIKRVLLNKRRIPFFLQFIELLCVVIYFMY